MSIQAHALYLIEHLDNFNNVERQAVPSIPEPPQNSRRRATIERVREHVILLNLLLILSLFIAWPLPRDYSSTWGPVFTVVMALAWIVGVLIATLRLATPPPATRARRLRRLAGLLLPQIFLISVVAYFALWNVHESGITAVLMSGAVTAWAGLIGETLNPMGTSWTQRKFHAALASHLKLPRATSAKKILDAVTTMAFDPLGASMWADQLREAYLYATLHDQLSSSIAPQVRAARDRLEVIEQQEGTGDEETTAPGLLERLGLGKAQQEPASPLLVEARGQWARLTKHQDQVKAVLDDLEDRAVQRTEHIPYSHAALATYLQQGIEPPPVVVELPPLQLDSALPDSVQELLRL